MTSHGSRRRPHPRISALLWVALIGCALAGCGQKHNAVPEDPGKLQTQSSPPSQPASQVPAAADKGHKETLYARVRVVDLDKRPLKNMEPIATKEPNAFNAPVVRGGLTDGEGRGDLFLPQNERLYVRAWDPALGMFANNFFEVPPAGGTETPEMEIVMVPAAAFDAALVDPNGQPVANEDVRLMMSHPTRGAWWPADSKTDAAGAVRFGPVPAGKFIVTIETSHSGKIDLPEIELQPASQMHLDTLRLKQ